MTIDPWEPAIEGGRLYGRGSCDVKGGMACMLTAFARLAAERPEGMPTVLMACTVNEEDGFTGARALAGSWSDGDFPLLSRRPDAVVVAEPTSLDVVVAHKGVVRWRCHSLGRAAHSSCPDRGDNAIYHMGHALIALQQYAEQLSPERPHAELGPPTITVGTIHGGICVNAVADRCTIEIDRRLLPDEDPGAARQDAVNWLSQHVPIAESLRHDPPFLVSHALANQADTSIARQLQRVIQQQGHLGRLVSVPYGTDAPCFAAIGIPTVVFGPGSIAQAHTASEWIALEQLHAATDIYYTMGSRGAGAVSE